MENKLGQDILLLDLNGVCDFTDYFVIASGTSDRMLNSLSDAVSEGIKSETGENTVASEGGPDSGWMILDYGGVVVHLMSPEMRHYYSLEDLWQKGKVLLRLQ